MRVPYADRREGGRALAEVLHREREPGETPLVLALPRGGVPVGYEVAKSLSAPLDVFIVRKLGLPGHEELAMGAIASGGTYVLNEEVARMARKEEIAQVAHHELRELERRELEYRDARPPAPVHGHDVIVVDDGLATGASMRAAVRALRALEPKSITVGVPVAAPETCQELEGLAERVICAATPEPFHAVGLWYEEFSPTTDEQVRELLQKAEGFVHAGAPRQ